MSTPAKPISPMATKSGPIAQFEAILKRASEKKASDVHLKAGLPPIVRVNGNLYYLGEEAGEQISRLTNAQLLDFTNALMNDRQKARYEAGEEVDLGFEVTGAGRFRINICQQRSFPRLVCRHIPEQIRTVAELELPKVVEDLTMHERGLVLVTGATGSGKSTTLAAMIDHIARNTSSHIITLEDPIEFGFKDRKSIITQREVGMDTKSFVQALKYALRQDPDVILVGEMRDEETILMAMSAAETGHLVFSTLHTNDASETINRILGCVSTGMQAQARAQLASVLIGVISQRLLITKDGKGRTAAVEVLLSNQRVKDMILDPKRTADLHRVIEESQSMGMQSFDQSLMQLFKANKISKEEAMNACTNLQDFQLRLEGVVNGDWQEAEQDQAISRAQRIKDALNGDKIDSGSIQIELDTPKKKTG